MYEIVLQGCSMMTAPHVEDVMTYMSCPNKLFYCRPQIYIGVSWAWELLETPLIRDWQGDRPNSMICQWNFNGFTIIVSYEFSMVLHLTMELPIMPMSSTSDTMALGCLPLIPLWAMINPNLWLIRPSHWNIKIIIRSAATRFYKLRPVSNTK